MPTIQNKWVVKEKKNKASATAPSKMSIPNSEIKNKPKTMSHTASYSRTLRGVRK